MILLTPQDVSKLLNRSSRWVYDHARELGAARIGKVWIFTREGLENAILGQIEGQMGGQGQDRRSNGNHFRKPLFSGQTFCGGINAAFHNSTA